jgi:amino acid adenylation domain-containing protein
MLYNVLQLLENDAERFPDKIALEDDDCRMTYAEYMESAKKVGTYLVKETDACRNRPIAVLVDRNIKCIVAFLGIVYSGNFYVPIDTNMPEERLALIFQTLKPLKVIDARKKEGGGEKNSVVSYTDIILQSEVDQNTLNRIRSLSIDTDPLYSIFTSGSTGVPKGVLVSHRSVIDLVGAFDAAFAFPEDTVFGNQAPFDFDVSVKDVYNALYVGGTVEVLAQKLFKMPKLLVEYLREKKVDTLIWAVSALRIVADFKTLDDNEAPKLRNIMFSGEVMPVRALNYWMDKVPDARFVNLYGPTEITCNCTYHVVEHKYEEDKLLPIGKPFINSRVLLRDEENHVISECGKVGEICVSGTCLALGYWNNPERTGAAFIQNPEVTAYPSVMYATGDMGYYDQNGDMVFAARKDYQIKHMGHRIELGEVEAALNAIPFLTISCCLYDKEKEQIVCFYQAEAECKKDIVLALSKKLPKYMWPNTYIHYEQLPMNKNGKIDRVLLGKELTHDK